MRLNIAKNAIVSLEGGSPKCLNVSWNNPKLSAEGLFDVEKTRKHFKNRPEMTSSYPVCSGRF